MKPLALSILSALAASGAWANDTIVVSDVRFRGHDATAAELTLRVREAVQRTSPEAKLVENGDEADLTLAVRVGRGGLGYRASLELRDRTGALAQRATATCSTRRELAEALEAATADLLRRAGAVPDDGPAAASPARLPEVPPPAEAPAEEGALVLEAGANVLVAWDRARAVEAQGKARPDDAAEAWREVAEMHGRNPFREVAATRARRWAAYAEAKRASETQRVRDAARLRKVVQLASVADSAKVEMLVRFAQAYGFDKVSPFVALLPSPRLRERAELSLDCEVKEAQACVQLARAADDPKAALDHLERACAAGAAEVCAEVGERWLSADPRDPARAVAALEKGCEDGNPFACVRLARVHEEGEAGAVNPGAALAVREKACAAGDGKSCRRLAGTSDDPGRVADLLRKGCDGGDGLSCALAQREPAIVQRTMQDAAAGAKRTSPRPPNAKPAMATEKPAVKPPAAPVPRTELMRRDSPAATVGALLAFGAVAGTAAYVLATDHAPPAGESRYRRAALVQAGRSERGGRTAMTVLLGGAAVLSTGAGLAILFSRPDKPEEPKVGLSPRGLVVSGEFR